MRDLELVDRREVFAGRVVALHVDRVRLPDGRTAELEVARHRGAAAVVPITEHGQVLLLRQYRHAVESWVLEIPAGKLDEGEKPTCCARRELEEETGFAARDLVSLGWIWSSPGFTDERIWLFLARRLERTHQDLERDEVLTVVSMPFAEAVKAASQGTIQDGKSVCGLLRAAGLGDREGRGS